ncbi:MAG: hypothetical protein ACT4O6_08365 [Reyranella sp.]
MTNHSQPIAPTLRVEKVQISGFAVDTARAAGDTVRINTRGAFSSDEPIFHTYLKQLGPLLLRGKDVAVFIDKVNSFVAVIHPDETADVYVNDFPVMLEAMAKRKLQPGQVVQQRDLADIRTFKADIPLTHDDKVVICFKVGWKFGLAFDLHREHQLDVEAFWKTCGALYRHLAFESVYEIWAAAGVYESMRNAGWFPFIELLGSEWDELLGFYRQVPPMVGLPIAVPVKFTDARIEEISSRWWAKSAFAERKPLIDAGLQAFIRHDDAGYIQCITTLYPQIEGILRAVYFVETGKGTGVRTPELLTFLKEKGKLKSGSDTSLFFPVEFFSYLTEVFFAGFDLDKGQITMSRHSAGHGVASASDYSDVRALQAILILDQIYFYL